MENSIFFRDKMDHFCRLHVTLYVPLGPCPSSSMCPETPGPSVRAVGLLTWVTAQVGGQGAEIEHEAACPVIHDQGSSLLAVGMLRDSQPWARLPVQSLLGDRWPSCADPKWGKVWLST